MELPRYFSFDGEHVRMEPLETHNWSATIKIREPWNTTITLQGIQGLEPWTGKHQIGPRTLPLLKSNLQKTIRRKDSDRAIRTALAMYSYKPVEVLRRLPMIMIEDALLYPDGLTKLVWWMCAVSKGYKMSQDEVGSMLGIVDVLCESDKYEVCQGQKWGNLDWRGLNEDQRTFMWAMELRKQFGGMQCDVRMINFHQELWLERFRTDGEWWRMLTGQESCSVDLESVDEVSKNDILLEAMDYHVYPWMIGKMKERVDGVDDKRIKYAIWTCRSRLNMRKPINESVFRMASEDEITVMKMIAKDLDGLCGWLKGKIRLLD